MKQSVLPPPPAEGIETNAAVAPSASAPAIWIRPPIQSRKQVCPYTQLSHGSFYGILVGNPRIRQARLGKGRERGQRLLWLPDVYAELERISAEQRTAGKGE